MDATIGTLVALMLLGTQVAAVETALVRSEFIFVKNSGPSCHATTIAETRDGTLLTAWFAGTAEGKPDVCIWMARREGGQWSVPVQVADGRQLDGKRFSEIIFIH